jgi:hypothetical protein
MCGDEFANNVENICGCGSSCDTYADDAVVIEV